MSVAPSRPPRLAVAAVGAVFLLSSCAGQAAGDPSMSATTTPTPSGSATPSGPASPTSRDAAAPAGPVNVYAGTGPGKLSPTAKRAKSLVYVPNSLADTVQVIDPTTFTVIATYPTGREPQHVVPSWDLKTLWVNNDIGNDLVPINPITGKPRKRVRVEDPSTSTSPPTARTPS